MDKREFLDRLRGALSGRIAAGLVAENMDYYENYINTEIRKGRSEEEVLSSLGDPRLLAKTIIQTQGGRSETRGSAGYQNAQYQNAQYRSAQYQGTQYQNAGYRDSRYRDAGARRAFRNGQDGSREADPGTGRVHSFQMPAWLVVFLGVLVSVVILMAVFSILSFLAPLLLIVFAIFLVVKLFHGWLK